MAKQKEPDILSGAVSKTAVNKISERFERSNNRIEKIQNNLDKEDLDLNAKTNKLNADIDKLATNVARRLLASNANNTESAAPPVDSMFYLANPPKDKEERKKRKANGKKIKQELEELKKEITTSQQSLIRNVVESNKSRFWEYLSTYNLIIRIIPKMRLALKTVANTIISPDDFTKCALNIMINSENINEEDHAQIKDRVESLITYYDINTKLQNDVIAYLRDGKLIYLVLSMNEEIKQMLSESASELDKVDSYRTLNLSEGLLNSADRSQLLSENTSFSKQGSIFLEEFKDAFGIEKEATGAKVGAALDKFSEALKDTFIIGDSSHILSEYSDVLLSEDMNISSFFGSAVSPFNAAGGGNTQPVSGRKLANPEKEKILKTKLGGNEKAIVKRVSPGNIVDLTFEDNILGYLYLDIVEVDPDGTTMPSDKVDNGNEGYTFMPSQSVGNGNVLQNMVYSGKDIPIDGNGGHSSGAKNVENPNGQRLDVADDARLQFLAAAFANRLSDESNIKLIKKSATIKQAIYNTLSIRKLTRKDKVRVIYLKPEEVVMINRGHSIFDNILFFAKIYITTLLTLLMQNVLRGAPKRAVYVEVGLDNNPANATQQAIRDVKSKEISSITNMDMQSIINYVGEFQDYYIPVVDGEKPITFETIDALDAKSLDDDFLNWLSNNIFSGMGIPSAYLTEVENVDFAKTLSMQNSRFIRDIIGDQVILSKGYTELIRKIYNLNFKSNEVDDKSDPAKDEILTKNAKTYTDTQSLAKAAIKYFDINNISVKFPSPASLNMNNLSEQISNVNNFVTTLTENLTFDDTIPQDDQEKLKKKLIMRFTKKNLPNVDWDELDSMMDEIVREYTGEKVEKSITTSEEENEEGSEDVGGGF